MPMDRTDFCTQPNLTLKIDGCEHSLAPVARVAVQSE